MADPIIRFALDPTGVSLNNLVINENHTLDANVQIRAIAPIYGPFYADSLVIKDLSNSTQLTNTQFSCVELLQDATMQFGQGIYALILITDTTVSQAVSINYQVLGGQYQNSAQAVITAYETLLTDNRPVDWSNVLNKPTAYPPSLHEHLLSDVYGFQSVVAALERIRNAIILSDVPTLQAVIDWAWSNWGGLVNLPLLTKDDVESGIPARKYVTYDLLLYLLDIYKGGSQVHTYLTTLYAAQRYSVNVLVNTFAYPQNTTLYWTISNISTNNTNFATTAGSFVLNNNTGHFTVQLSADIPITGEELFRIQIRKDSPNGQIIALTDAVTIAYQTQINTINAALTLEESLYHPQIEINPTTLYFLNQ